jgi:hypothetical protein
MGRHIVQEQYPETGVPAARHRVDNRPDFPVEKRRGRGVRRAAVILALAVVATGATAGLARAYWAPDQRSGTETLVATATASGAALAPGTRTRVRLDIVNTADHAVTLIAFGTPQVTVEPASSGCDPAAVGVFAPEAAGVLVPAAGRQILPVELVMAPEAAGACQGAMVQVRMTVSGRPSR